MKYPKFSHKTPHLKGKQHQLDPNLDLKQLVHHSTVQYVDRDADGDVDVYDSPKKKIPDENVLSASKAGEYSKKLIAKQKGELKHTKRGIAYEETKSGDSSLHDWFSKSKSSDGKPGWVQLGGKYAGKPCAKQPGQTTKPKCGSSKMKRNLDAGEEEAAFRRKNRQDPNPERKGKAINVRTEEVEEIRYCPMCKKRERRRECSYGPDMWDKVTVEKFSEAVKDHEYSMARSELSTIMSAAKRLRAKMSKGEGNIEAWVQSKITKAADYLDSAADYIDSGEMEEEYTTSNIEEAKGEKDACYHKVKSRYKVWPSAYASGALVKCRKVGADSWGTKSEQTEVEEAKKCWPGYEKKGTQKLFGKTYNRCVKKEEIEVNEAIRIPAKTGNIILVTLMWRGKYYGIKMFFPQIAKPSRKEVQDQIDKVYPGAKVQTYYVSEVKPGEQFLQTEDWQKVNRQDKTDGLSQKAVNAYRRENPGSKLQTAVTEKKPTGKRAERRKSFCRRMKGMKSKLTSAKTSRDPDSRINKALRRWNCN